MLALSFAVLLVAGLFGAVLAGLHLRPSGIPPAVQLGVLHGLLGAVGLGLLLLALGAPARGAALGVAGFGRAAAWLAAAALVVGVVILTGRLRRWRGLTLLVGTHATLAISAVVVLAAYVMVR